MESDGADHASGDLTAGEIRPVKAIPCLRLADQQGRLTRWVLPICLSGAVLGADPGAPSVFSAGFKKELGNDFLDFC